jgi:hypothetical protein
VATMSSGQFVYESEEFAGSRPRRVEEERADTPFRLRATK